MSALRNLTSNRFERLTVVKRALSHDGRTQWECRCDCGKTIIARGSALTSGNTRSCGCLVADLMSKTGRANGTHRMSRTQVYRAWARMLHRCYNSSDIKFASYGGRGITVCVRWRDSFENFLADMGPNPTPKHSIDRYPNNDGNYEPTNCRWATSSQQNLNRRKMRPRRRKGKTNGP